MATFKIAISSEESQILLEVLAAVTRLMQGRECDMLVHVSKLEVENEDCPTRTVN
jgi:hypothetical protein